MKALGMEEMNRVFEVVDDLEISREAIQVELLPAGDGRVERLASGKLGIVLPAEAPLGAWLGTLRERLAELAEPRDMESLE